MLLGVWLFRPGTINPWIRRHLHFLHHKKSGTAEDLEEQGIGNGMSYRGLTGLLRMFIMMDTFSGNLVHNILHAPKGKKIRRVIGLLVTNFPLGIINSLVWYSFLIFHGSSLVATSMGAPIEWSAATLQNMEWINVLVVLLVAPFYLRSFSINFISSSMHYYGDVKSTLEQTQVLNHPIFWPFQLFCFNFGSTHGIHHFVISEPFYIRQLTANASHKIMKENGVRFNDFKTFGRANSFN